MLKEYSSYISGGIAIHPEQMNLIRALLSDLNRRTPAQFSLVVDAAGQSIACEGEIGQVNIVTLAALVASDLAASQEIARLTGELDNYQLVLREGKRTHTLISEAGPHLIVFAQIQSNVSLGWARTTIRETARKLLQIISTPIEEEPNVDLNLQPKSVFDHFSRALDDLWKK